MKRFKIAIVGCKGIPAKYGGFETLAENLSIFLSKKGHHVTVFCSGKSAESNYKGVELNYIRLKPNRFQGILYDLIALKISLNSHDKILMLGSPAGPFLSLFPGLKNKLYFNFGGLDFHRNKWSAFVRKFIEFGKINAIKNSKHVIADNNGIKDYIIKNYHIHSEKIHVIEYGGDHAKIIGHRKQSNELNFIKKPYCLTVARIQKDNNIEVIISSALKYNFNLVIIGNWDFSRWGRRIKSKYKKFNNLYLINPIYDIKKLFEYRINCHCYIHGHSAGGTNPTLVEAMFIGLEIFAFDNIFNRHTTNFESHYWANKDELGMKIIKYLNGKIEKKSIALKNFAEKKYNWDLICGKYLNLICNE